MPPAARAWRPATWSTRPPACRRPHRSTASWSARPRYHATDRAITYRGAEPVVAKGKSQPLPVVGGGRGARAAWCRRRPAADHATGRAWRGGRPAARCASPLPLGASRAAGHAGRRTWHRQEPPGVGADAGGRARSRLHHLAAGTLAALRRRRHLLGARRDGEGAGGHPRLRLRPRRQGRSCALRSRT